MIYDIRLPDWSKKNESINPDFIGFSESDIINSIWLFSIQIGKKDYLIWFYSDDSGYLSDWSDLNMQSIKYIWLKNK